MKTSPICFLIIFSFFISCKNKSESETYPSFKNPRYQNLSSEQKKTYLDSVREIHSSTEPDSATRNFYFKLAAEYYYINDQHNSFSTSKTALSLSKKAKDTTDIARAFYYLGDTYEVTRKDSAYFYYLEAEKLYRLKENKEGIAKMLFNKSYILFFEGNYVESEIELSKALKLLISTKNYSLLYSAYTLMGANMEKLEEYDDAMKYYNFARDLIPELERENVNFDRDYNHKIVSALNISNIYEQKQQYGKSIEQLQKFLTPQVRKNWPGEYSKVLANLAYAKMKNGQPAGVEGMFLDALRISEKYSSSSDILYKLNNLGEYYLLRKDTVKAQQYLKRSLEIGEKIRSGEEVKKALKLLAEADVRNSERYENRFIFLNDSLSKVQRKNRNKYARIEYETEILQDENKTLSSKYSSILIVAALLIVLVISLLVLRHLSNQRRLLENQRQKQRADEEIFELLKEQQIKILQTKEEEQNRISRDLHDGILNKIYGVRLQLGLLNRADTEEVKLKRMQYIDMLQQIEKEIRGLSHDLHVEKFHDQFDFKSLLANLIGAQNDLQITHFNLEVADIDWDAISGPIKITIYRILQEASLNVIKYAEAKKCDIEIKPYNDTHLLLTIADNGKGFIVEGHEGGIGLKNMRTRAKDIGAIFKIESAPGKGTKIELRIKY